MLRRVSKAIDDLFLKLALIVWHKQHWREYYSIFKLGKVYLYLYTDVRNNHAALDLIVDKLAEFDPDVINDW